VRSLAVALLAACGGTGPKKVLADYLAAEQSGRYEDAHALLATSDRAARSLDAYAAEHLGAGPVWLAVARTTRFEIGEPTAAEPGVRISVLAAHADVAAVARELPPPPADRLAETDDALSFSVRWYEGELGKRAVPEVAETVVYALVEESPGWRVWLGLDRQDAAVALLRRAEDAERRGDAPAARAAWDALLALPEDPAGVVAALKADARRRPR
jgi:hypothetical protein